MGENPCGGVKQRNVQTSGESLRAWEHLLHERRRSSSRDDNALNMGLSAEFEESQKGGEGQRIISSGQELLHPEM